MFVSDWCTELVEAQNSKARLQHSGLIGVSVTLASGLFFSASNSPILVCQTLDLLTCTLMDTLLEALMWLFKFGLVQPCRIAFAADPWSTILLGVAGSGVFNLAYSPKEASKPTSSQYSQLKQPNPAPVFLLGADHQLLASTVAGVLSEMHSLSPRGMHVRFIFKLANIMQQLNGNILCGSGGNGLETPTPLPHGIYSFGWKENGQKLMKDFISIIFPKVLRILSSQKRYARMLCQAVALCSVDS